MKRIILLSLCVILSGLHAHADPSFSITYAQLAALMRKTKIDFDDTPPDKFVENPDPNTMQVRVIANGAAGHAGCSADGKVLTFLAGESDAQQEASIIDCYKVRAAYLLSLGQTLPSDPTH